MIFSDLELFEFLFWMGCWKKCFLDFAGAHFNRGLVHLLDGTSCQLFLPFQPFGKQKNGRKVPKLLLGASGQID